MTDASPDRESVSSQPLQEDEPERSATRSVRPQLVATFAALLCALIVVMTLNWDTTGRPYVQWVSDAVEGGRTAYWHWRLSLNDPQPGASLAVPGNPSASSPHAAIDVVVFTDGRLGCCGGKAAGIAAMVEKLAQETSEAGKIRWTLVIGEDSAGPADAPRDKNHPPYEVIWDIGRTLSRRYNAYFTPRTYILRDSILVWAQPPPASEEERMALLPAGAIVEHVRRAVTAP